MKEIIIILSIIIVALIGVYLYKSKVITVSNIPVFTQEDGDRGWYPGETKRLGTPDTWILELKGTENVRWTSPWNSTSMNSSKTLSYNGIVFFAPNKMGKGYYVLATKDNLFGKVLWEIGQDTITGDKDEIVEFVIKNVAEVDLDSKAVNFQKMKVYIDKPALWIKMNTISGNSLWMFVDINTGLIIGTKALDSDIPNTINDVPIKVITTTSMENIIWKQNSVQNISWSVINLPKGNFNSVIFLTGYDTTKNTSGSIIEKSAKEGIDNASYTVGTINSGGDAITNLPSGPYKIVIRIYKISSGVGQIGYGEFVYENTLGNVIVK